MGLGTVGYAYTLAQNILNCVAGEIADAGGAAGYAGAATVDGESLQSYAAGILDIHYCGGAVGSIGDGGAFFGDQR